MSLNEPRAVVVYNLIADYVEMIKDNMTSSRDDISVALKLDIDATCTLNGALHFEYIEEMMKLAEEILNNQRSLDDMILLLKRSHFMYRLVMTKPIGSDTNYSMTCGVGLCSLAAIEQCRRRQTSHNKNEIPLSVNMSLSTKAGIKGRMNMLDIVKTERRRRNYSKYNSFLGKAEEFLKSSDETFPSKYWADEAFVVSWMGDLVDLTIFCDDPTRPRGTEWLTLYK